MTNTNSTGLPRQRRPRDTRNMTLHRLIEGISIDEVLDYLTKGCQDLNPAVDTPGLAGSRAVLVSASYAMKPSDLVGDLLTLTGVQVGSGHRPEGLGAALFVEVDGRVYLATFGKAHTWIEDSVKDRSFGLSLAVRCLDPAEISDVVRLVPAMNGRVDSTLVPGGSPLWNMRIDQVTQMVRKIKGGTIDLPLTFSRGGTRTPKLETASSIHTHLGITPAGFIADVRTFENILRTRDVHRDLQFIENIVPVHCPTLIAELDDRLDSLLGEIELPFALAVPIERMNAYSTASSFQVCAGGARLSRLHPTADDIALLARRQDRGKRLNALRRGEMRLYASYDTSDLISHSSLLNWIEASVSIGAERFTLREGEWYQFDATYLSDLERDVHRIFDNSAAALVLPPWQVTDGDFETERQYNIRVGDTCPGFLTLDRRTVKSRPDRRSELEICDLLGPLDELVHVKLAEGSDVLSHLFFQGLTSAENLARADIRERFCAVVDRYGKGRAVPSDFVPKKVVYGIMLKTGRTLTADTLFPFAQVTLRHAVSKLNNRGIAVDVVGIPQEFRSS
ncbi:TIGR04141 family sporadically distributed protein [Kineosporia mesophila]|uniref:TIGR04141 family sporadically distributed protein n=1 Tax=Kineosporia mesophila TaxID=566012 RepID=A0ABP7A0M4_9ACTN|nr:DUF6119 family protein [Kineosporia mesophila]MCD5353232.1 TIGR04141 family sporadically distributed protein [Kineosporia mesophila]